MFGFLFCRWRKASKCRKLLQQLQSRLKILKNTKYAISRHLRHDIALFVRINDPARALLRTNQLFLVENSISIYDLLLQFSDFIILHFSYIRKHRELHNDDINEAVSSLVFASARCGELHELLNIRELFGQRYGQRYVTTALQLLPTNLVNCQLKEKLCVTSVSEDVKSRLLDEIAKESGLRFEILRLEYTPETEKQVNEEEEKKVVGSDLKSCSNGDHESPEEVYKFSVTDVEKERSKEETPIEDDDYIEEAQVGKDQRVFRFRESSEEEKRSSSSSSLRGFRDMESLRYYKRRNTMHRRRRRRSSSDCYHIVYNVFKVKEEEEKERRRLVTAGHVHPKLPDYDQIVAQFKALKKQHSMHS